jgi:hypothetical protein
MPLEIILRLNMAQNFQVLSGEESDSRKHLKKKSLAWRCSEDQGRNKSPMFRRATTILGKI